jgi:hypothetical protein
VKSKWSILAATVFLLTIIFSPLTCVTAQDASVSKPEKALSARMLRFGQEAYVRGKYLDAKEYFRKAVIADPTSLTAWRYYDQAVIFGLAEKVEKNANLVLPDVSTRQETKTGLSPAASPAPPKPAKSQPKNSGFKIIDDEGC